MKSDPPHPDDPFAGYGPQSIRCRWLSPEDEERAGSAKVIRLVVDGNWWSTNWSNAVYQRNVMREVAAFLGPTQAVVVTPAGMITTTVGWLDGDVASVATGLRAAEDALGHLDFGPASPEMLLGLDGCVPGEATPLQTVVHVPGEARTATAANTTMKLYPNNGESQWLVAWLLAHTTGDVPAELAQARRVKTASDLFLVLVCHDACLFSARSQAKLEDLVGLRIRDHFRQAAAADPTPAFTLIATHVTIRGRFQECRVSAS